ncbi:hypothetical protein TH25_12285 [Thalassospira profundimaris]|uniref:Uncharacterized protein n=1 Tax=Thalassospira profundimaris TaxID=502049 RepID=A0A367XB35_9PROT|nr:hypothetical protein [Thalassospira profundimaris]RCK50360.1 hypothetical protein TH25_12285 [Thalassospira profundimaris]
MSTPFTKFTSPAHQAPKDYKKLGMENELPQFENDWNAYVAGWTESSIIGNPWTDLNDAPRSEYYNPLVEGFGEAGDAVITWTPFPNRLITFFNSPDAANNPQLGGKPLTMNDVMSLADTGKISVDGKDLYLYDPSGTQTILQIPVTLCPQIDWEGKYQDFSPSGPRGWLDEYCEWSITYDGSGAMRSVMFTCENPAYYLAMWRIDPKAVLGLYQTYIDPAVKLEDLYLRYTADVPTGKKGDPVMDPTTGRPAYDVTNKWNNGTVRVPGQSGGAMHLTSGPNTLSAEVYLAAAATIQRPDASSRNAQSLICCAKYGQNFRNSDPHIGFVANRTAGDSLISLTDPVGLYIQQPQNFANWKGPNGEDVSQYWHITRGTAGTGPNGSDQILHAIFEIPESAGFTINDVTINDEKIAHVGDIANQMHIALSVTEMAPSPEHPLQAPMKCVTSKTSGIQPWPVQFIPQELFYGLSPTDLPALLKPGTTHSFTLIVQGADVNTTPETARIEFSVEGITAKVTEFLPEATPIPGKTDGGGTQGFQVDVSVAPSVPAGPVQMRVLNPAEPANPSDQEHPWESGLAIVANS